MEQIYVESLVFENNNDVIKLMSSCMLKIKTLMQFLESNMLTNAAITKYCTSLKQNLVNSN